MSLVIQSINRPFSPANIYPTSFWLLCFIPSFITKTPTIHNQNTYYWLYQILAPPIPYSLKARHIAIFKLIHQLSSQNRRFLISHLTLSFSIQSTFRERRFIIHLKYFLQIYPPQKFGGLKKVVPLHPPLIHLTLLAFFIITLTGCCIEWNTSDFHTLAWWSIGAIFARNAFSYGLWRWQRNWQYAKRLTNNRVWLPSLVSLYRRLVLRNRLSIDAK